MTQQLSPMVIPWKSCKQDAEDTGENTTAVSTEATNGKPSTRPTTGDQGKKMTAVNRKLIGKENDSS